MLSLVFLGKAKGYKKHGAIAVLFVFVEMVCLSAYRGRFYGREWYLRQICLVILSLAPCPAYEGSKIISNYK